MPNVICPTKNQSHRILSVVSSNRCGLPLPPVDLNIHITVSATVFWSTWKDQSFHQLSQGRFNSEWVRRPTHTAVLLPLITLGGVKYVKYISGPQCCFLWYWEIPPQIPLLFRVWNSSMCLLPNLVVYTVPNAKQFHLGSLKWKDDLWKKIWQFSCRYVTCSNK